MKKKYKEKTDTSDFLKGWRCLLLNVDGPLSILVNVTLYSFCWITDLNKFCLAIFPKAFTHLRLLV